MITPGTKETLKTLDWATGAGLVIQLHAPILLLTDLTRVAWLWVRMGAEAFKGWDSCREGPDEP